MGHAQYEKQYFDRNNKSRSSAFRRNFLFYQNIMFSLSYESFSILSNVFCQKTCHFQLKQLVHNLSPFCIVIRKYLNDLKVTTIHMPTKRPETASSVILSSHIYEHVQTELKQ